MGKTITFEYFKKRAKDAHGDKYSYHEETFKGSHKKTVITCPIHGDFKQVAKNHMNGQGCPVCGFDHAKKAHKCEYGPFLEKAKTLYGDKFEYPYIEKEYENNKTKITIRCAKCGYEFTKRPNDFLNKNQLTKCKQCASKMKKAKKVSPQKERKTRGISVTAEMFMERFKKKFGDEIIPHMDEYVDTQKEMHFECRKCGHVFMRAPDNCLNSKGCPKCHDPKNKRLTTEEFIERARKIHGDKYDYSESEYSKTDVYVTVICHAKDEFGDEHGRFKVTPHAHIGSMHSGCPKCSKKFSDKNRFVKLANLKYNNLYTYDNFVYGGAFKESYVTCAIHGDFATSPNRHLNGHMCPKCIGSTMEREISALLSDNNIHHFLRKHFKWLGNQELDVFIPEYNIAIECQGPQHFKPIDFYGGEDEFEKIKKWDETKKKLCEENGIKLLYYSDLGIEYPYEVYEDKNELLKEIIKKE